MDKELERQARSLVAGLAGCAGVVLELGDRKGMEQLIITALRAAHAAGRAEGLEAGAVGYADLDARHTDVLALTAGMPAVVEAAQHLLGTLNYANGSIPRRSVGYFLFDDGNNVHADIAKLRATLDALEGNNGA